MWWTPSWRYSTAANVTWLGSGYRIRVRCWLWMGQDWKMNLAPFHSQPSSDYHFTPPRQSSFHQHNSYQERRPQTTITTTTTTTTTATCQTFNFLSLQRRRQSQLRLPVQPLTSIDYRTKYSTTSSTKSRRVKQRTFNDFDLPSPESPQDGTKSWRGLHFTTYTLTGEPENYYQSWKGTNHAH